VFNKCRLLETNGNLVKTKFVTNILKSWQLYLLLVLPIIYILIFSYYPMLGAQIAFKKYIPTEGIWGSDWIGLYQFKKLFSTPKFYAVFKNTLTLSFYSIIVGQPITVVFALCLNAVRSNAYKKMVQMVTYMPHFISMVVMVGILVQIFNPRIGLYGRVCELFGLSVTDIFSQPEAFSHIYVWSAIWQQLGWGSIIYLAALSNVDISLYESAEIDGANRFKRMIYIDFPSILPTVMILLIMRVGQIMSVGYEKVLLMQNSLNLSTSEIIATYSYKVGLQSGSDYSYGAAIGLFNSLINFTLLIIVNRVSKKATEICLW